MTHLTDGDVQRYLDRPPRPGGDSEPDRSDRPAIDRHLQTCVRCRDVVDRARAQGARVDAWLSALADVDVDPASEAALARVRATVAARRPWMTAGWQWAAGLAAVVLAIVATERAGSRRDSTMHATVTEGSARQTPSDGWADFVSLDGGAPMQMGLVVRVTVPASALARYGVAAAGDVQADVLVGEDGTAHGFRVVR